MSDGNNETAVVVSNAVNAMAGRGELIPGDVVNKATAGLPDGQRSAIRRLHAYYIENELSLAETGKLIGYTNGTVVSLVFRGKYDASVAPVVKAIEDFFELHDKRAQGRKLGFIETDLTKKIWNVCDAALEFQKIAFVFSDAQIGKSEALKAYAAAHNHGSTIYVRMPTGGALLHFLTRLARTLRISDNLNITKLRERIINAFDDRMLLIVDEAHECTPERGSWVTTKTIDFIREIFDETGCGVVICATNIFRDAMENGPVFRILRQTKRRRLCALQLPNVPRREDLNAFSAGHGLPPSSGAAQALEKKMVEDEALGMWLTLLRMGAKLATQRKEKFKWDHVLTAHAGLKALEGQKF
jgi:hypothetical protein